jgi:hypothetical protein
VSKILDKCCYPEELSELIVQYIPHTHLTLVCLGDQPYKTVMVNLNTFAEFYTTLLKTCMSIVRREPQMQPLTVVTMLECWGDTFRRKEVNMQLDQQNIGQSIAPVLIDVHSLT